MQKLSGIFHIKRLSIHLPSVTTATICGTKSMEFSINSTLERVQKTSTSYDDVISVDMRDVTVMEMTVSAEALFATEMDQSPG